MATYESKKYATIPVVATQIADGSVTNSEYQFINSLSSNAQSQINTKLNTAGGTITGNVTITDNDHLYIGDGQDIDIISDGSTGFIKGNDLRFQSSTGENYITTTANGATKLFHNNVQKAETTGSGLTVSGAVAATTITGNGSALTSLNGSNISSGTIPSARVSGIVRAINSTTTLNVVPPPVTSTSGTAPTFAGGTSQSGASVTIDVTNIDRVAFTYGMESWIAGSPTDQNYCTSFTGAQIRLLRSGSGSAYLPSQAGMHLNDEFFSAVATIPKLFQRKNQCYNFVYEEDVSGLSGNVTYTNDVRAVAMVNVSGAYSNSPQSFTGRGTNLLTVVVESNWINVVGH